MLNSIDPDETAHYEQSHLDLHCFQNPFVITYGSERVKEKNWLSVGSSLPCTNDKEGKCFHTISLGSVSIHLNDLTREELAYWGSLHQHS